MSPALPPAASAPSIERTVWLLRHGETAFNKQHRLQGQLDLPLNSTGREQARAAGTWLEQHVHPQHFVCSDLTRACETAALALPRPTWTITPAWRERHLGRLQGLTKTETAEKFPDDERRRRSDEHFAIPGGGESGHALRLRVIEALEALPTGTSLVTTHGGVIQAILRWILAVSSVHPLALAINNGSLHCLSSGPTGWRILETGRMAPTPSP